MIYKAPTSIKNQGVFTSLVTDEWMYGRTSRQAKSASTVTRRLSTSCCCLLVLVSKLIHPLDDTRRRLRSADTAVLVVPSTRCSMLDDRAFPMASARAWNSLPSSVRNAPSLTTFRRELKTVFFRSSFDND